jgi:hypothetical protein
VICCIIFGYSEMGMHLALNTSCARVIASLTFELMLGGFPQAAPDSSGHPERCMPLRQIRD